MAVKESVFKRVLCFTEGTFPVVYTFAVRDNDIPVQVVYTKTVVLEMRKRCMVYLS